MGALRRTTLGPRRRWINDQERYAGYRVPIRTDPRRVIVEPVAGIEVVGEAGIGEVQSGEDGGGRAVKEDITEADGRRSESGR